MCGVRVLVGIQAQAVGGTTASREATATTATRKRLSSFFTAATETRTETNREEASLSLQGGDECH